MVKTDSAGGSPAPQEKKAAASGSPAPKEKKTAVSGSPAPQEKKAAASGSPAPKEKKGSGLDKRAIGGRLLQLRGMRSQEEVAAALGIRQSTLAMYERGSRMPRDEIKLALAHYYGCSVEALFFSENDTICGSPA